MPLPNDIYKYILGFVPDGTLASTNLVSRLFYKISKEEKFIRILTFIDQSDISETLQTLKKFYAHPVFSDEASRIKISTKAREILTTILASIDQSYTGQTLQTLDELYTHPAFSDNDSRIKILNTAKEFLAETLSGIENIKNSELSNEEKKYELTHELEPYKHCFCLYSQWEKRIIDYEKNIGNNNSSNLSNDQHSLLFSR